MKLSAEQKRVMRRLYDSEGDANCDELHARYNTLLRLQKLGIVRGRVDPRVQDRHASPRIRWRWFLSGPGMLRIAEARGERL